MDPLGNQVGVGNQKDGYGNPLPGHISAGNIEHQAAGTYGGRHGVVGQEQLHHSTEGVVPTHLKRSNSSSSSSSEDDGVGGRRKKGIKEKVKEKLPGGHKDEGIPQQYAAGVQPAHEKKGVMEKIKEKLPGNKKAN